MEDTNIYVLGAGSIGCLFSYYLKKYNNNVILITRDNNTKESKNQETNFEKSLSVEFKYKSSEGKLIDNDTIQCLVKTPTQISNNNEKIKILLITTKSPDTLEAIKTIESSLHSECTIILMQNGVLGTYSLLTEYFLTKNKHLNSPLPRILVGTTSNGSYRISPLNIVHAGKGTTYIGEPNGDYTTFYHENNTGSDNLELINHQFSPLQELNITVYTEAKDYTLKLLPLLQTKLIVNACLNPLTALFECLNGWIVDIIDTESQTIKNINTKDHPCSSMIKEICQEAAWVLVDDAKDKINNDNNNRENDATQNDQSFNFELPISLKHLSEKAKSQAEEWEKSVIDVAKKTCLNRNSMLQDIDAKRVTTEIEFLNGFLVKEATKKYIRILQEHSVFETPNQPILKVNEMLVRLIKIKSWIRSQN
ncbi:ApbA-domain-containing protein [Piromyces finnis]|uniref:2-dehydropantoate 2-reductase n=1 Tax=Piromyces finnis TaxID=1754191 RepID=A0A1Y1VNR1_9FUNG|nr:ApbA-domain-containing protein [Piromyces finnis]|eukprot:ORX60783.1 ApbA-domain-containing protein [Piromyces finnis]